MKLINIKAKKLSAGEADRLIDRYYEGLTTNEEEDKLRQFLSQPNLPDKYAAEQAIFGYMASQKQQTHSVVFSSVLKWAVGAAAMFALVIGVGIAYHSATLNDYAYINGKKITNIQLVKKQAFLSMNNLNSGTNAVEESLKNVTADNNQEQLIKKQLAVFQNQ